MIHPVKVDGARAWRKTYDRGGRPVRLAALRAVVRVLDLPPLLPPPYRSGEAAKQTEKERIQELDALGVSVPRILDEGSDELLLSDLGPTLSSQLREARGKPQRSDALVSSAVAAIGDAHRRGGYLSQAWPRNLTVHRGGIGFLDFEEDPREVMSLADAQARDWLLFAYGTMRYYRERPRALEALLRGALHDAQDQTLSGMADVATRLQPLARGAARFGRSARTFSQVLGVIRASLPVLVGALVLLLGLDWIDDGEISLIDDLVEDLVELF